MRTPPGRTGGAQRQSRASTQTDSRCRPPRRGLPPLEVIDPIPCDKLVLFHVVTPRMLARLVEHFRRGPVRGAAL
jgi:hypothetical protein